MANKTGVTDFGQLAKTLTLDVFRTLKLNAPLPSSRELEPEESLAWRYASAYFDEDPDAMFGIVHRQTFENLLRNHFKRNEQFDAARDPGWYALRNVVYAAGSRIISVRASSAPSRKSFLASKSWRFFLNAFSVHMDLLYFPTSLMAVSALAMMVSCHLYSPRADVIVINHLADLLRRGHSMPSN